MRVGILRRAVSLVATGLLSLLMAVSAAQAKVAVWIDISRQTMTVSVDGWRYAAWRVSTARRGYWTPRGSFQPYLLKRMHYSSKYENSPMPHSIFFRGGYAIHGTYYVRSLGRPVSHGCVRLAPANAARLYTLVQQYGKGDTRIVITNGETSAESAVSPQRKCSMPAVRAATGLRGSCFTSTSPASEHWP